MPQFDALEQRFGGREEAMEQIILSLRGKLPDAGKFEVTTVVDGQDVVVRGIVIDGIARIGTAFTP